MRRSSLFPLFATPTLPFQRTLWSFCDGPEADTTVAPTIKGLRVFCRGNGFDDNNDDDGGIFVLGGGGGMRLVSASAFSAPPASPARGDGASPSFGCAISLLLLPAGGAAKASTREKKKKRKKRILSLLVLNFRSSLFFSPSFSCRSIHQNLLSLSSSPSSPPDLLFPPPRINDGASPGGSRDRRQQNHG